MKNVALMFLLLIPMMAFSQKDGFSDKALGLVIKKEREQLRDPGWYMSIQFSPFNYIFEKSYGPEAESWLKYVTSDWYTLDNFDYYSNELYTLGNTSGKGWVEYNILNRVEVTGGYYVSDIFNIGAFVGYMQLYHAPYADAKIRNILLGIDTRLAFGRSRFCPYLNIAGGKNLVPDSKDRLYQIKGDYFGNAGLGFQKHIYNFGFIFIEFEVEYSTFAFEDYLFRDVTFLFLNSKIGVLF
ncbi:hypothetical protein ACFLTU_02785 [Bacteroidota bacterium]